MLGNRYPWKLFWLLLAAALLGVAAVVPYSLALAADAVRKTPLPLPLPLVLALQVAQNGILFTVAVGVGLLASRKVGLGAPFLEAWVYERRESSSPTRIFAVAAIAGAVVAALSAVLAQMVFAPLMPQLSQATKAALPLWKRFLACFYGAINEEILMRLFLLSGLLADGKTVAQLTRPTVARCFLDNELSRRFSLRAGTYACGCTGHAN